MRPRARITGLGLIVFFASITLFASPPWWTSRNVLETNSPPADYAPLVLGQLKWMATNAYLELQVLPGGAGSAVLSLVQGFQNTNNWLTANVGQLKCVAAPFYDRLITDHFAGAYPWTSTTNDDRDYAIANIGQLKFLFDFDVATDSDSDGLPDSWEIYNFGSITNQSGTNDYDGDGLVNTGEYAWACSPTNSDTDGDGFSDTQEIQWGSNPANGASYLVSISGTITYAGHLGGLVWVRAYASGSLIRTTTNSTPGAYSITNLPNQTAYYLEAWRDTDGNGSMGWMEAQGSYPYNPLTPVNSVTGINITLVDVDSDGDGLPDLWEDQYFYSSGGGQTGYMDFDNDGINNLDEYTGETNPYDGLSLQAAGKGSATVCWHPPQATGTTAYVYNLYTNSLPAGSGTFGSGATTNLTITNLQDNAQCHIVITATNTGAGSVVWTNWAEWTQPGNDIQGWYLFANVPTQNLAGAESVIMTREFQNVACTGHWDRFYISSSFTNAAGFALAGLKLQMEAGGTTNDLCDYGWSGSTSLDATGNYWIPEGPTNNVKIHVRFNGAGAIGIDKRLYLLRWNPGVNLAF